ncbi:hypothetical protein GCM10010276_43360 [Streptomyces longisporus]|uniref:Uncharacterized protein n=1 Tax=Streptomyces longisporus TaxID=1948 RepID=A0ABN3M8D2_STRLO
MRGVNGASGSDWVLPWTSGRAGAGADPAPASAALAVATGTGRVSGRARAAAQATPIEEAIEEARNPRMLLILDIVIHICPYRI